MDIKEFFRTEGQRIYLKTSNGCWKRFENVLADILADKVIKLKKRKIRLYGKPVLGAGCMGKRENEIWIYAKLPQEEKEKTLIHEITELHFDETEVTGGDDKLIEEITQKIWQNLKCREEIRKEARKWRKK